MLNKLVSVIVLFGLIANNCEGNPVDRVTYDGFKLYMVFPETAEHRNLLVDLQLKHSIRENDQPPKLDFWLEPRRVGGTVQVLVSGSFEQEFTSILTSHSIRFKILEHNVKSLIEKEANAAADPLNAEALAADSDFRLDQYHSHDDINVFLKALAKNPAYKSRVFLEKIGVSYEGRHMLALKIGTPGANKPSIFIDAGIHAREWIAPATALYFINILVSKYGSDPTIKNYVDKIDWYILPSVNPDGYEFSRNNDRFWRKTRSKHACDWWKCCYGVDPNRNFDYMFGYSGTSNNTCSDVFLGEKPFSEPETVALSKFITDNKATLKAYLTLHSYGQFFLVPYGYKLPVEYAPDYQELVNVAQDGANALERVHGTKYLVGNAAELLEPASGASDDWAKHAGVKFVYTIELRPNSAQSGFALPPQFIIPTAEEVFEAVKKIADKVLPTP